MGVVHLPGKLLVERLCSGPHSTLPSIAVVLMKIDGLPLSIALFCAIISGVHHHTISVEPNELRRRLLLLQPELARSVQFSALFWTARVPESRKERDIAKAPIGISEILYHTYLLKYLFPEMKANSKRVASEAIAWKKTCQLFPNGMSNT